MVIIEEHYSKNEYRCRAIKYDSKQGGCRYIQCKCHWKNGELFCNKHLKEIKATGFIRNGIYNLFGGWWNCENFINTFTNENNKYPNRHRVAMLERYGTGEINYEKWNEEEKDKILKYCWFYNEEEEEKVGEERR